MLSRNRRHIRRRCATCCPLTGVISPPSGRLQPTGRMPRPPPDRSISRSGTTPEQLIYRNSRSARPWRALVQNQDSKRCDRYGVVVEAGQNRRYFVKLQSGRVLSRNRRHIRRRYGHAPPTGICSPTLPSAGRPPQHPPLGAATSAAAPPCPTPSTAASAAAPTTPASPGRPLPRRSRRARRRPQRLIEEV